MFARLPLLILLLANWTVSQPPEQVLRLGSEKFRHPYFGDSSFSAHWLTPDGKELITYAGPSKHFRFWEPTTGKLLRQMRPEVDGVLMSLAYSPDCKELATWETRGETTRIVLRDGASGKCVRTLAVPQGREVGPFPENFRFLPGGKEVACFTSRNLLVWEKASGRLLVDHDLGEKRATQFAVAPNGQTFALWNADNNEMAYWEWEGNLPARRVTLPVPPQSQLLGYAPDGRSLFLRESPAGIVQIDATTNQPLRMFQIPEKARSFGAIVLAPDGKRIYAADRGSPSGLASHDEGGVIVWSLPTGEILHRWKSPGSGGHLALSADGNYLALNALGLPIWDTTTGQRINPDTPAERTHAVRVVAGPERLVTLDRCLPPHLWDAKTGQLQAMLEDATSYVRDANISPDGRWLATGNGDDSIGLFDLEKGKLQRRFRIHGKMGGPQVRFTADGKSLVSFGNDYRIRTTDLTTGEARAERNVRPPEITEEQWKDFRVHHEYLSTFRVLSRRGEYLLLAGLRGQVVLHDATTGSALRQVLDEPILHHARADFSPNGKALLLRREIRSDFDDEPDDNTPPPQRRHLLCLDTTTAEVLWKLPQTNPLPEAMHISPDGKTFALAVSEESGRGRIEIRWLADGSLRNQLKDLPTDRLTPHFLPDGKRLAIVRRDGVVEIHRLK